ncbi:hypothetical protein N9087_01365 [bacterium]|nr:hypothetical protein [bacterium]
MCWIEMVGCSMHISGIAVAANFDGGVRCGRIRAQAFRVHVMVDRKAGRLVLNAGILGWQICVRIGFVHRKIHQSYKASGMGLSSVNFRGRVLC